MQKRQIQRVAVIGAGISGVVSAAHLLRAGFDVTIFERNSEAGGIWIHDSETSLEPPYPCMTPAQADAKLEGHGQRTSKERRRLLHAPPGPCYDSLRNNIDTPLMQTTLHAWPEGTPRVVSHPVIKGYIQETSEKTGADAVTVYGALVSRIWKVDSEWRVQWALFRENDHEVKTAGKENVSSFDAVIVASGHYHAPRIPDVPGLADVKSKYPNRIRHSKYFRNSVGYEDKNVLLIGGGVSSTDIARDIGRCARNIYQSTRGGMSDMPASVLPGNATRVSEVAAITMDPEAESEPDNPPFTVHLVHGSAIPGIDRIIICTGYQFTLPFLPQYHDGQVTPAAAGDHILTTDGGQMHNLHRDIFYIPDPTLTFVGIPLFTTTFTLFEFQAMAVTAFYAGLVELPPEAALRREYQERVQRKGLGRYLHSLKEEEEEYVNHLVDWVNEGRLRRGLVLLEGHTAAWKREKQLIREAIVKLRAVRAAERAALEISRVPVGHQNGFEQKVI